MFFLWSEPVQFIFVNSPSKPECGVAWSLWCYQATIFGGPLLWQHIMWTLRNISLSFITPTCLYKTPWAFWASAQSFPSRLLAGLLHILSPDYIINILTNSISDMCVGMHLDYSRIWHQRENINFTLGRICNTLLCLCCITPLLLMCVLCKC